MTREFGCKEAVELLWAYLDHELDDADGQAVQEHLSFCLRCCGELEFAREMRTVLAGAGGAAMPDSARRHLEGFIDSLDTGGNQDEEGGTS